MTRSMLLSPFSAAVYVAVFFATATGVASQTTVDVQPRSQVVLPGQPIRLMCRTGVPIEICRMKSPTVGWFLKPGVNESDPSKPVYDGQGYQTGQCGMTVRRASEVHNGRWSCSVAPVTSSGSQPEIENTATITVARSPIGPQLKLFPATASSGGAQYEFREGDSVRASCQIADGRPPANISWYLDDQIITEGLSDVLQTRGLVNDTWTVAQNVTRVVSWQDNGRYLRCIAQHIALSNTNNQSSVMLNVRYPPQPHSSPIEKFGFEVGQEGIIAVTIEANPRPKVVWDVGGMQIQEGSSDPENHYRAGVPANLGAGTWEATLTISHVEEQDIEKQFMLRASNDLGAVTYKIALSTNSEPTVMELGAGTIIGIVVAILFVLLVIFLVIFARATGRWCFAGGVSSSRNDIRESSDTESADHGPTHKIKTPKMNLSYIFNMKKDKVSDEVPETPKLEPEKELSAPPVEQKSGKSDIVYAELDLKDVTGKPRPQVRPEEDRTEYAEIVYTAKAKDDDTKES